MSPDGRWCRSKGRGRRLGKEGGGFMKGRILDMRYGLWRASGWDGCAAYGIGYFLFGRFCGLRTGWNTFLGDFCMFGHGGRASGWMDGRAIAAYGLELLFLGNLDVWTWALGCDGIGLVFSGDGSPIIYFTLLY